MPRKKTTTPLTSPPSEMQSTAAIGRELKTLDEQGKPPRQRLRNSKSAHSLFLTLLEADRKSAHNRAILTEMWDGAPPQKDSALQQIGMGFVYNLNFKGADTKMAAALAAYDDLLDSSEHLIVPHARPNVVSPDDLVDVLDVISEEHAVLVREQSNFYSNWNRLASAFVGHGVGFAYFPDEETPWWKPAGWDNAYIPRKTEIEDEAIAIFITRHEYRVNDLYKYIADPETMPKGWSKIEVQKAIIGAARGKRYVRRWYDHWPEVEIELKNNDLGFGVGDSECVQALHYWVKEFDGSYSFYIGLENGLNQDYLYQDASRYANAQQAFVSFTLSVGNGTFHSVRGALWKMFDTEQASNRFLNKMLTNTDIAMTMLLQGQDGDSYDDMQIVLGPAVGYLPPGANVVDRKLPDVGTQGMPVVQFLDQKSSQATGQFQAPAALPFSDKKGHPNTKYAEQKQDQIEGALNSNSVNRFYRSADRLTSEQWRRIMKIGPTGIKLSGLDWEDKQRCRYPEIRDFFERCSDRGVTYELMKKAIRKVTAQRAIGNGSPQLRLLALNELQEMAGSLDETGRALATRDRIALRLGRVAADRYKPKVTRLAPDTSIALLENNALSIDPLPALPDQNHNVHAGIHVPKFQQLLEELVNYRESDPEAPFAPMEPKLQHAFNIHDHASQHVQALAADPLRVQDMKSYRAALEQGGNLLAGFARELQQQERHQADQYQMQSDGLQQNYQDAVSASNQKLTLEVQRQQEELQQKRETHMMAMQLASAKVSKVAQEIRLKNIETDSKIAQGIRARQTSVPEEAAV